MRSKIILILIFILAICLASPIAASDNVTDDGMQSIDEIEVSYNHTVYKEDLGSIDVKLPENTSGNLRATINDAEFYNQNVSSSVKIPITIPKQAISLIAVNKNTDHVNYHINLFFNDLKIKDDTLKVMNVPSNFTTLGFPSEILKDDPNGYVVLYFPESANGTVTVYIDGNLSFNLTAHQYTFLNATKFNSLGLGNHNVTIVYSGDEYYRKFSKTFNFTVVEMLIQVPANIVFDHDDCISGKIINNRDGVVTVYVDNKLVFKDRLDSNGEFLHSLFKDITCGNHLVEVQYNASNFNYSKRVNVTASYYVDIFNWGSFIYGDDSQVVIIVPTDFNKNLINITVDGKRITDFEIDNSGWIEIGVSKLDVGNHTLEFNFPGDGKYTNYTISDNFTIHYQVVFPYFAYFGSEKKVYLYLPKSANGFLEVYIDGKAYGSSKFSQGYAEVNIEDLVPGYYNISARYTGSDFNVAESSQIIEFEPDFTTPGEIYCGDDKSIVVKTVKAAKGKVIFNVGAKNITVDVKNGKAALQLKDFKVGYYDDIIMYYVGDNGYETTLYGAVDVLPAIKLTNVKVTSINTKMKVYIRGKLAKNAYITFKVDGKTKKIKTDKKGIATIKLAPGKHTIKAIYKTSKATKSVNVHVITLKSVQIKKSAKKVVLKAILKQGKILLKNKVVKFKFNGKTVKVKTNKKGVAKATFKTSNLKAGKKVTYKACYLNDIVKKTVTVKK